jgi:hypothetical protein
MFAYLFENDNPTVVQTSLQRTELPPITYLHYSGSQQAACADYINCVIKARPLIEWRSITLFTNSPLTRPYATTISIAQVDLLLKAAAEPAAVKNQPELRECTTPSSDAVNSGGVPGESGPEIRARDAILYLAWSEGKPATDGGEGMDP